MLIEFCRMTNRLMLQKNGQTVATITRKRNLSMNENYMTMIDIKFAVDLSNESYWPESKESEKNFYADF